MQINNTGKEPGYDKCKIICASTHVQFWIPESVWQYCLVLLLTQVKNIYWSMGADSTSESRIPGEGYSISGICRSANFKVLAVVWGMIRRNNLTNKPQSIHASRYCASCVWKIIFYLTRNSPIKQSALLCKLNIVHITLKYMAVDWYSIVSWLQWN